MTLSISALLSFLLVIVVVLVVIYCAHLVVGYLELPEPIRKVVMLIVGLIGLIVLLLAVFQVLGVNGGLSFH